MKINRLFTRLASLLLVLTLCLAPVPSALAADTDVGTELIADILSYKLASSGTDSVQAWLDGELTAGASETSEWYVMALRQYDPTLDFSRYAAELGRRLEEKQVSSASTRERLALAMVAANAPDDPYIAAALQDSVGEQGVMSWAFGLHLLNNTDTPAAYSAGEIVDALLALQLADGGWAVSGTVSDPDVTAMVLCSLAPRADEPAVSAAVDSALAFLSAAQHENGTYASYGVECAESCAVTVTALCSLGIDPCTDERFVKNGVSVVDALRSFALPDGSMAHQAGGGYNHLATTESFYAAVALYRFRSGCGPLFLFDDASRASETVTAILPAGAAPVPAAEPETAVFDPTAKPETPAYKPAATIAIAVLAVLLAVISRLRGKRHAKTYLALLIAAAAMIGVVWVTDFRSAEDYYSAQELSGQSVGTVTLSIRCDTLIGRSGSEYVPADGVILPETEMPVSEGDSVYDVLVRAVRTYGIQMESEKSGPDMYYVSGLGYLYEFDFGDLSGWTYFVNGVRPSVGCGEYELAPGDAVVYRYTCDLGEDLK